MLIATVGTMVCRENAGRAGKVNCQMKCKFAKVIAKHFKDEPHP